MYRLVWHVLLSYPALHHAKRLTDARTDKAHTSLLDTNTRLRDTPDWKYIGKNIWQSVISLHMKMIQCITLWFTWFHTTIYNIKSANNIDIYIWSPLSNICSYSYPLLTCFRLILYRYDLAQIYYIAMEVHIFSYCLFENMWATYSPF